MRRGLRWIGLVLALGGCTRGWREFGRESDEAPYAALFP